MPIDPLDRFRVEFRKWVLAHNAATGLNTTANKLLAKLEERIPAEYLMRIGSAYLNKWLVTETGKGRGYFVREGDRPGQGGGQFTIERQEDGTADPCWELYIQLADYAWLRTITAPFRQYVRLGDSLMNLTVRADDKLVFYVEHKEQRAVAEELLAGMRTYGRSGFGLDDPDVGKDSLRKSKYLVRANARPLYFGLSAVNLKSLFRVEYLQGNRFDLHEEHQSYATVLGSYRGAGAVKPKWNPVDALAIEIERLCRECWVSTGSGGAGYNFYAPLDGRNVVVVGIYESGDMWTDTAHLGSERVTRLQNALAKLGVELAIGKIWTFWKRDGKKLHAGDIDPAATAEVIRLTLEV